MALFEEAGSAGVIESIHDTWHLLVSKMKLDWEHPGHDQTTSASFASVNGRTFWLSTPRRMIVAVAALEWAHAAAAFKTIATAIPIAASVAARLMLTWALLGVGVCAILA
jgi:hypothetical protein